LALRAGAIIALAALAAAQGPPQAPPPAAVSYKQQPGPYRIEVRLLDWTDAKRGRSVPVKIYYPADAKAPAPLIVLSHGLGGSREGYEYLGRHWAGHGYISLHIQHIGSDDAVWRGQQRPMSAMRKAAADPLNAVNRARDVRFVIDEMERLNAGPGEFAGRVDLARVGIAGHSFGANTTLVASGQLFILPGGKEMGLADPRIKAAIPMSAPVPRDKSTLERAFGKIAVPCLHMTGTLDDSPIGETGAADRRLPFDHISGPDQHLVIFEGGDHMIFSGRGRGTAAAGRAAKDTLFQDLIRQSSTAFWDAYLLGDAKALAWLAEGGFEAVLGANGAFEKKLKD
jgi:predicted dienelactone hydrolase